MIELIAAASIGGIVGFGACAVLTAGKVEDVAAHRRCLDQVRESLSRCRNDLTTTQRKLSAIRDLLDTPQTIRKGELAAVLDGDV